MSDRLKFIAIKTETMHLKTGHMALLPFRYSADELAHYICYGKLEADQGKTHMAKFRSFIAIGLMVGISAMTSACSTTPNSTGSASAYVPGDSMNRACEDGFRPNFGRSCSY